MTEPNYIFGWLSPSFAILFTAHKRPNDVQTILAAQHGGSKLRAYLAVARIGIIGLLRWLWWALPRISANSVSFLGFSQNVIRGPYVCAYCGKATTRSAQPEHRLLAYCARKACTAKAFAAADGGRVKMEIVRAAESWIFDHRPGYFGKRREEKIAYYNQQFGEGNWRLVWRAGEETYDFVSACKKFYEESYYRYLKDRPGDIDFICSYGECIDNAPTNVQSGLDYSEQESSSTHIQDVAIRNVLSRLGRRFEGLKSKILVIRGPDSEGFCFNPGNVPFHDQTLIQVPRMPPSWAYEDSVESFWQSNKWLQRRV